MVAMIVVVSHVAVAVVIVVVIVVSVVVHAVHVVILVRRLHAREHTQSESARERECAERQDDVHTATATRQLPAWAKWAPHQWAGCRRED